MTFDFFEGAAGTGKTHNLVSRVKDLVRDGVLGESGKLLALTYMNGARRRIEARLAAERTLRGRFECQTFDVFARTVATRRRSLLVGDAASALRAATLNEFDRPCYLAGVLLEKPCVQQWVSRTFPLILVDEAQDLDEHRMHVLQGLSQSCSIVAAADAFQCLTDGRDTTPLIRWLEGAGEVHRLTQPQRTNQQGLLDAALAVREGRDLAAIFRRTGAQRPTWVGPGFRLIEAVATNPGIIARTIAEEISYRTGDVSIISPNTTSPQVRNALSEVGTRIWPRRGSQFGPYVFSWDRQEIEEADDLLEGIALPERGTHGEYLTLLGNYASHPAIASTIARMDRFRRVQGKTEFTAHEVSDFVRDFFLNQSRLGLRRHRGHLAMTIHRAKNREFPNVIVLWPHALHARASPEHLQRLLYNGITRAKAHCTVIVLGQGRLNSPPFAPQADPVN